MGTFTIALYQPQIPPNTGNIARLCAATKCDLHIIKPMGFVINDKTLKRAGLDYWENVTVVMHELLDDFLNYFSDSRIFYVTKFGKNIYTEMQYKENDVLLFGSETTGLPKDIIEENIEQTIKIPMCTENVRSLNLANSVAIVLYEALRQLDFKF